MSDRHQYFFGTDPKQPEYPLHQRAIEARVSGNYRVFCEHCGVGLMGEIGHTGGVTQIGWRHDGDTHFGKFTIYGATDRDGESR